jgi:hypothetical protein
MDYVPITAGDLYALSQQNRNTGDFLCHWCGSQCHGLWGHDDSPPIRGLKNTTTAKRPGDPYICVGCWLWRRQRITVQHLSPKEDGKIWQKDGQCPKNHSWYITRTGSWIVTKHDFKDLYEILLKPPICFMLMLLNEPAMGIPKEPTPKIVNQLHLARCNDLVKIEADTELWYTIDNIPYSYTIYELEQALLYGKEGKMPGVHKLISIMGKQKLPNGLKELPQAPGNIKTTGKSGLGRPPLPPDGKATAKRLIAASGQ